MKNSLIIRFVTICASVVALFSFSSNVVAKQFKSQVNGREVVVHTNPLPVILHRLVPPQHGRHVTQREVNYGKVPQPTMQVVPPRKRP